MRRGRVNQSKRPISGWHLIVLGLVVASAALVSCDKDKSPKPAAEPAAASVPTLRIYALSGPAGAIEPCGCVKDMLGGIDHAAAYVQSQHGHAPHSVVLGAGPMFFEDPELPPAKAAQAGFKATTMADALGELGLIAWAPAANDWGSGVQTFNELAQRARAKPLAANLGEALGQLEKSTLLERGGVQIGVVGVSIPERLRQDLSFSVSDASQALAKEAELLTSRGAKLIVALVAAERGTALRMLEAVADRASVQVAVLGKPFDQGEGNDSPISPEVIGNTLVVQSPNHLQSLVVVDLFVRDGNYQFVDGGGLNRESEKQRLDARIEELSRRLENLERQGTLQSNDLAEQKKALLTLRAERRALDKPAEPPRRSYFSYKLVDVKESYGQDSRVAANMREYYRQVNQYNKQAFADRLPRPVPKGEASYVGIEACSECHKEEREFWNTTGHSRAYATLATEHKEYNLDCVACHVTGYEKPGGSTVTHVDKLKNVGCEVCHGPGSAHVALPKDPKLIQSTPPRSLCADSCHHPPHVHSDWDVVAAWQKIIGPGHGRPKE